jgi:hypothetical protein
MMYLYHFDGGNSHDREHRGIYAEQYQDH